MATQEEPDFDKEKYLKRYRVNNHMRGMLLGALIMIVYYEFFSSGPSCY